MRKKSGFTLIELVVVVAVIAVIFAVAIPNLLRSRVSANEAGAVGAIRTVSAGEVGFQTTGFSDADGDGVGDYGTLGQLADPDGAGATPPLIDQFLGSGSKHGYSFTIDVVPGNAAVRPRYTCTATPLIAGRTGYRQYFVNASGVIRFTADGSTVSAASAPLS